METLTGLRGAVSEYLRSGGGFSGCDIREEYPAARRGCPLEKPVIAVGIDSLETREALGGFLGAGTEGDLYGACCLVTMRFDIFTPSEGDGPSPHRLMEQLWEALFPEGGRFGFTSFHSGPIVWDRTVEANRLTTRGKLRAVLAREDKALPAGGFRVTGEDRGHSESTFK